MWINLFYTINRALFRQMLFTQFILNISFDYISNNYSNYLCWRHFPDLAYLFYSTLLGPKLKGSLAGVLKKPWDTIAVGSLVLAPWLRLETWINHKRSLSSDGQSMVTSGKDVQLYEVVQ